MKKHQQKMHFFRKMHISFPLPRGITQAPKQGSIASANRPLALPYLFNAVNEPRAAASVKFSAGKYASSQNLVYCNSGNIAERQKKPREGKIRTRCCYGFIFSGSPQLLKIQEAFSDNNVR
jgi:hypothetical protein